MRSYTLGTKGLRNLSNDLGKFISHINKVTEKCEDAIAEQGLENLNGAVPEGMIDGNQIESVFSRRDMNGRHVGIKGNDVAFIEFGTGIKGMNQPYEGVITLAQIGWTYDVNKHGRRGWYYKDKFGVYHWSRGMVPQHPVLTAYRKTGEQARAIIKDVVNGIVAE